MNTPIARIDKYAKLSMLATLVEPMSLSELGIFWYSENGRFYKDRARFEINQAIKNNLLIRVGPKVKANTGKLLDLCYSEVSRNEAKDYIKKFWSHPFSANTYLNRDVIKRAFSNPEKASEADLKLVFNLPIILTMMQDKDPLIYSMFVHLQELERYTIEINMLAQENLKTKFSNLNDKLEWMDTLNRIIKMSEHVFPQYSSINKMDVVMNGKNIH